jgi:hypothetical protein
LSTREHGELWHFVFTQRAIPGEPLKETRERFEKSWKRAYRKMRLAGLVSGLVTYHLVRNGANAWHWHAHLVAEMAIGSDGAASLSTTIAMGQGQSGSGGYAVVRAARVCGG